MDKNQGTKEKVCTFFASDYHFEMISLPYINKKVEDNKEVIILTENNLEDTIKVLISKMNLKENNKDKILNNIDWKNNDLNKFKKIKQNVDNKKETIIFIKGKENYIENVNKNIEKWISKSNNTKVIDCYDIEEIGDNIDNVMSKYNTLLSTKGEKEIEKI